MTTWVITGANRGIGLELARAARAKGDAVVALCRKSSPELDATGARVEAGLEITSAAGIAEAARRLASTSIDVLVQNAGVLDPNALGELTHDGLLRQMEVNAFAPLLLTQALLPRVTAGGRIMVVTSRMGSIGDNGSGGYYGYRMSKAAVNAAFVSLARDLAPRKIAVGIVHPGMVATGMTGGHGIPAADSAAGIVRRIDALDAGTSGRFFHQNGEELPW